MPELYPCRLRNDLNYPDLGVRPPELYQYPIPTSPIRMLFVGWNPPRPFGGFWSLQYSDKLRNALHEILCGLNEITAPNPNAQFLKEFLDKGFYFIHAVKCWSEAKYPKMGQGGRTLLSACVKTHLHKEIEELAPQKVCTLGALPMEGLACVYPTMKSKAASPSEGKIFHPSNTNLPWPLLITCFPQPRPICLRGTTQRVSAKELMRSHLKTFISDE